VSALGRTRNGMSPGFMSCKVKVEDGECEHERHYGTSL